MSGGKPNNDEVFNNPFSSLKKQIKTEKKGQASTPVASPAAKSAKKQAKQAEKPVPTEAEDAAASALFLSAMGRSVSRSSAASSGDGQSMAELMAEADKKSGQAANKPTAAQTHETSNPTIKSNSGRVERDLSAIPEVELSSDESVSFAQAMQGVKPVDASRGRALVPPAPPAPIRHQSAERDYLAEFTEGKFEFALEYTEEFFEGHVMGMDPLVVAKLRAGQYSPESHIDLHGMNTEQAYAALLEFIRNAYNQGRRNIIVVTGRGKNSPGGLGVLRQHMQDWLTKEPLRRVVLAFCTAQPKDGGAGALYVILRKYKKSQGKIRWDRDPWEEKPLI